MRAFNLHSVDSEKYIDLIADLVKAGNASNDFDIVGFSVGGNEPKHLEPREGSISYHSISGTFSIMTRLRAIDAYYVKSVDYIIIAQPSYALADPNEVEESARKLGDRFSFFKKSESDNLFDECDLADREHEELPIYFFGVEASNADEVMRHLNKDYSTFTFDLVKA